MRLKTILILLLMLPVFPVGALSSDDQYKQTAVDWVKEKHPELAELDDDSWVFNMSEAQTQGKWTYRIMDVRGTGEEYELEWNGRVRQKDSWGKVSVNEFSYTFTVMDDPPSEEQDSTPPPEESDPTPPPEEQDSTPPPEESDPTPPPEEQDSTPPPEEQDSTPPPEEQDSTPPPEEPKPGIKGNHVEYEDGLSWGYMWRDRHVLLVVRVPGGPTHVNVTIVSVNGVYSRTVLTYSESLCIYFKPYWFEDDYILVVTADRGTFSPEYILASR